MKLLVLDVGTSSMRGTLMDENAAVLAGTVRHYCPDYGPDGRVEQEPSDWLQALDGIAGELSAFGAGAVAITSQRSSVIAVDESGAPLGRAIMWQDTRSVELCRELEADAGEFVRRCGASPNPVYSGGKMAWLRRHEPETYRAAYKLLVIPDLLIHHMTGRFCTDHTYGSRSLLMDLRRREWDTALLTRLGLEEEKLCPLVPPGSVVGTLLPAFARLTGLPAGIPVVTCGGDQQCGALGMGVDGSGTAALNMGTGAYLTAAADTLPEDLCPGINCSAAAAPGQYLLECGVLACGSAFDRFCGRFCAGTTAQELGRALRNSPRGANGVAALPLLQEAGGPRTEDMSAGFCGATLQTDKSDFLRSLAERIACELGGCFERLSRYAALSEVSLAGGLAACPELDQLLADACGHDLVLCDNREATTFGAWMNAACALGLFPSLEQARKTGSAGAERKRIFFDPAAAEFYRDLRSRLERL